MNTDNITSRNPERNLNLEHAYETTRAFLENSKVWEKVESKDESLVAYRNGAFIVYLTVSDLDYKRYKELTLRAVRILTYVSMDNWLAYNRFVEDLLRIGEGEQ